MKLFLICAGFLAIFFVLGNIHGLREGRQQGYDYNVGITKWRPLFIHTEQDVCGYDDISLKRLTTKDIEDIIK